MRLVRLADLDVVLAGGPDGQGGGDGPLVVLMHGFGAPGTDLVFAAELPVPRDVRFAFPAGPHPYDPSNPEAARYWWFIEMMELQRAVMLRDYETMMTRVPDGLAEAREQVSALLDALEKEHGAKREKLVLGGFSQGAMLATDVTLRAERPPAALALWSGSLICRDEWLALMPARKGLPVLQTHGRGDPVLPYPLADKLRGAMQEAGLQVEFAAFNGGHTIPGEGLAGLVRLIAKVTA